MSSGWTSKKCKEDEWADTTGMHFSHKARRVCAIVARDSKSEGSARKQGAGMAVPCQKRWTKAVCHDRQSIGGSRRRSMRGGSSQKTTNFDNVLGGACTTEREGKR